MKPAVFRRCRVMGPDVRSCIGGYALEWIPAYDYGDFAPLPAFPLET
jgi:hypothetical protein